MSQIARGPTLGEQVYIYIRDRIINGDYRPGQVLVESELAQKLEVSRTPVSNALIMLKERGLLEEQGSKLAVPVLTIKDVMDLYQCRLAFDGLATRMAAELISAKDLRRLEGNLQIWEEREGADDEDDFHALWVADLEFHDIIYQVTENRHLIRFAQISTDLLAVYRRNTILRLDEDESAKHPRTRHDVWLEHRHIFEAIKGRDPEVAEQAAREHIHNIIEHLEHMEVIKPVPDLSDGADEAPA